MDRKLQTFLTVCDTLNYRMAAERLYLSQPAVTKHIQSLENQYQVKLIQYDGHRMTLTEPGKILRQYAISQQSNDENFMQAMRTADKTRLRVGATKTIGDYMLGDQIRNFLRAPRHELYLAVDNTEQLLHMLNHHQLDFIFVEGFFDKQYYDSRLFRTEPFVGICAPDHPLNGRTVGVEELFSQPLILREDGSGTRAIFERMLVQTNFTPRAFHRTSYISSFKLIRQLVREGSAISFAYDAIASEAPALGKFYCPPITGAYELNIVYPKGSHADAGVELFLGE